MERRSWYIISNGIKHSCEFVYVNTKMLFVDLKLDGVSFKVQFHDRNDYYYAKRGEEIQAIAKKKNSQKSIKIVFK